MSEVFYDPIVAEVRKNREALFAEFDYDAEKFREYIDAQRPILETEGFRYETEEDRKTRIEWKRMREEEEDRRIALICETVIPYRQNSV